jgi:hypothetical protein
LSNYTKTTNFTAKDALPSGDPNKVIKGSEFDLEFDAVTTASATKANKVASATVNNLMSMTATGDLKDSTIVTNGSGTIVATLTGNADTATTAANLSGTNLTGGVSNSGNTVTVVTNANLTGDVTSVGNATTIAAGVVDTDELAAGAVQRAKIQTATITLSGNVGNTTGTDITLSPYSFFPMIHATGNVFLRGHSTDGASADNARLRLENPDATTETYDIDYRYIDA